MRVAVIGRGPWSDVYRGVLRELGHEVGSGTFDPPEDAAIVANKASEHQPFAWGCAQQNIPTLVEKPLAMSSRHAEALIERASNTYLACSNVLAFSEQIQAKKEQLRDGFLSIDWWHPKGAHYDPSVPIVTDILPHIVSILDTIYGDQPIHCTRADVEEDYARLWLLCGPRDFPDAEPAQVAAVIERNKACRLRHIRAGAEASCDFTHEPHGALKRMVETFLDDVKNGTRDPRLSPQRALKACQLTEEIDEVSRRFARPA